MRSNCQFSQTLCQFVLDYNPHARTQSSYRPRVEEIFKLGQIYSVKKKKKRGGEGNLSRVYLKRNESPSSGLEGMRWALPTFGVGVPHVPNYTSQAVQTRNTLCQMPSLWAPMCVFCVAWNPRVSYPFTLKSSRCYPGMPLWLTELLVFLAFNSEQGKSYFVKCRLKATNLYGKEQILTCYFSFFWFP